MLRRVWTRHFERAETASENDTASSDGGRGGTVGWVRLRAVQGRGRGDRIESPYDIEARFRAKSGTSWTGYMVHITETCDSEAPRLIVHAEATPANVHEAMRIEAIHDALAAKGVVPTEHLADAGYVSGRHIVAARERHEIELIGPARAEGGWQARGGGRLRIERLHGGLGERARALPGGTLQHQLARLHREGVGAGLHSSRVQPSGLRGLRVALCAARRGGAVGSAFCPAPSTKRSPPLGRA